jgi:hypothetical protein
MLLFNGTGLGIGLPAFVVRGDVFRVEARSADHTAQVQWTGRPPLLPAAVTQLAARAAICTAPWRWLSQHASALTPTCSRGLTGTEQGKSPEKTVPIKKSSGPPTPVPLLQRQFFFVPEDLARRMHLLRGHRGPRSPPHRNFEVGPPINPVVRSSAPDPYGQDRALLSGQRPHFFLFFAIWPGFCRPTLDSRGLGALLCGVPGSRIFAIAERLSGPVGPA